MKKKLSNNQPSNTVDIFNKGAAGLTELIYPDVFHEDKDYIYLGHEKYCRVYVISVYPRTMQITFLNEFFQLGNVDISIYIENIPDGDVINRLTDKYSKIMSNIMLQTNRGNTIDYGMKLAASDLDELREAIQTNRDRMFFAEVFIKIWGKDLEDLNSRSEMFEDICARKSLLPRSMAYDQGKAFISTLPYMNIKTKENLRNMTTGGIACLVPTGNTELSHKTGVLLGDNILTGSKVFYDNFIGAPELSNPHMAVFGASGAGKSVALKILSKRSAETGQWIIMLDPEEEDKKLIKHLGGQYITLKAGVKSGINPFELEVEIDDKGNKQLDIFGKQSELREMLSIFCEKFRGKPLEGAEITTVEEVINKLYRDRGITSDPESLYEEASNDNNVEFNIGKVKKHLPTLSDLRNELLNYDYTVELADLMKIITGNMSLSMFDCETTVNFNNRIIGIDLKHLSDEFMKFFATVNILSWVWGKFSNWKFKNIKKRVIVDEAWLFARYERSAAFMEELARRGRKYKISLVLASQMINEFLATKSGEAVLAQCATKLLLKQDPSFASNVSEFFRLPERCADMLSTFPPGQGILMSESNRIMLQVIPFDFEWDYVTT